jgi:hypothetical protein
LPRGGSSKREAQQAPGIPALKRRGKGVVPKTDVRPGTQAKGQFRAYAPQKGPIPEQFFRPALGGDSPFIKEKRFPAEVQHHVQIVAGDDGRAVQVLEQGNDAPPGPGVQGGGGFIRLYCPSWAEAWLSQIRKKQSMRFFG